ncbi:MAG: hypothetical protein K9M45_13280 [Kiritimatiellales bacterium]|nr:hypothetical protein [Kiritimatiellales bacterium]
MKKNIIIIALLAGAVAVVVGIKNKKTSGSCASGCEGGVCTLPIPVGGSASEDAREVAPVAMPLPKLLDLGAGKCVPCKMMAPILDEMKETFSGKLDVEFIDVWENEGVGSTYGIRMIPTQIFYDAEGNELFRHEGFFARDDILAKWQELGFNFTVGE